MRFRTDACGFICGATDLTDAWLSQGGAELKGCFEAVKQLLHLSGCASPYDDSSAGRCSHAPPEGPTLSKAQIITRGTALGVPWPLTVSCYQADSQGRACGRCDSCRLRREGFLAAGQVDPTRYQ